MIRIAVTVIAPVDDRIKPITHNDNASLITNVNNNNNNTNIISNNSSITNNLSFTIKHNSSTINHSRRCKHQEVRTATVCRR